MLTINDWVLSDEWGRYICHRLSLMNVNLQQLQSYAIHIKPYLQHLTLLVDDHVDLMRDLLKLFLLARKMGQATILYRTKSQDDPLRNELQVIQKKYAMLSLDTETWRNIYDTLYVITHEIYYNKPKDYHINELIRQTTLTYHYDTEPKDEGKFTDKIKISIDNSLHQLIVKFIIESAYKFLCQIPAPVVPLEKRPAPVVPLGNHQKSSTLKTKPLENGQNAKWTNATLNTIFAFKDIQKIQAALLSLRCCFKDHEAMITISTTLPFTQNITQATDQYFIDHAAFFNAFIKNELFHLIPQTKKAAFFQRVLKVSVEKCLISLCFEISQTVDNKVEFQKMVHRVFPMINKDYFEKILCHLHHGDGFYQERDYKIFYALIADHQDAAHTLQALKEAFSNNNIGQLIILSGLACYPNCLKQVLAAIPVSSTLGWNDKNLRTLPLYLDLLRYYYPKNDALNKNDFIEKVLNQDIDGLLETPLAVINININERILPNQRTAFEYALDNQNIVMALLLRVMGAYVYNEHHLTDSYLRAINNNQFLQLQQLTLINDPLPSSGLSAIFYSIITLTNRFFAWNIIKKNIPSPAELINTPLLHHLFPIHPFILALQENKIVLIREFLQYKQDIRFLETDLPQLRIQLSAQWGDLQKEIQELYNNSLIKKENIVVAKIKKP